MNRFDSCRPAENGGDHRIERHLGQPECFHTRATRLHRQLPVTADAERLHKLHSMDVGAAEALGEFEMSEIISDARGGMTAGPVGYVSPSLVTGDAVQCTRPPPGQKSISTKIEGKTGSSLVGYVGDCIEV